MRVWWRDSGSLGGFRFAAHAVIVRFQSLPQRGLDAEGHSKNQVLITLLFQGLHFKVMSIQKSILLPLLLVTTGLLGSCGQNSSQGATSPVAVTEGQPGAKQPTLQQETLAISAAPQSWDYRIARVISNSNQQVVSQDVWNATAASVGNLHAAGKKVICYFSAGTWEYDNFSRSIINQALTDRTDNGVIDGSGNVSEARAVSQAIQDGQSSYEYGGQVQPFSAPQLTFKALAGSTLPGWDEYVYRIASFTPDSPTPEHQLLRDLIRGHMARASAIGCDALEPDNIDAYVNVTGITAEEQYAFNKWMADTAHSSGQAIYLKNDLAQIPDGGEGVPSGTRQGLAYLFDGLINEECFTYNECRAAAPFRDEGKPIFVREYGITSSCTTFRNGRSGGKTRQQLANELHLNVSVSGYENGGSPDANANAPKCTFGTW